MNRIRLRSVLIAGASAIGIITHCPAADAIDLPLPETGMPALTAIVKSALAKSPRTMARDFEVLNAEYGELISSSRLYPQVGGNYQFQVRNEDQGLGAGAQTGKRTYYSLGLSQPLWHWGTLRAASRIGQLNTKIAEHKLADARKGLALEVRDAYMDLVLQKMTLRNARFSDGLVQSALEREEAQFKAAQITQSAINGMRLQADESSLAAEKAASDLEFAIRSFRRLTGVDSFTEADIPDSIPVPKVEPAPVSSGEQTGYLKSESLQVNALQIEQAKLDNKVDRRLLWPKLSAIAGIGKDDRLYSPTRGTITTTSAYVGVQLQWSIFDGFSARGQKRQSRNLIKQLEETGQDLVETLKNSADLQARTVGFAWSNYKNMKVRNRMAEERLATENENLKQGLSSDEQINSAQVANNAAELKANGALADFYSASARYVSTMNADPLIDGATNN